MRWRSWAKSVCRFTGWTAGAIAKTESALKPPIQPPGILKASNAPQEVVWHTSWEEAREEAEQTGKLILADFTGSDWCHWCVKLKKDRFETPEFQSWAKDNAVLLELDFPRNSPQPMAVKIQNRNLKEQYDIRSYPTVLLLKPDGSVQAKMGYESGKSASQWVQLAESRLQQHMEASYVADNSEQGATVVR